jgi:hypothetical protein
VEGNLAFEVYGGFIDKEIDMEFHFKKNFFDFNEATSFFEQVKSKYPNIEICLEKREQVMEFPID